MQSTPLSPTLDATERVRPVSPPRVGSDDAYSGVRKLLTIHASGMVERTREAEAALASRWWFPVKRAKAAYEKTLTYARRVLLVDTERNTVSYLKASAALPGKPFPRALNVSGVLNEPKALDFLFAVPWKGSTRLRLRFASVRDRELFVHTYANAEAVMAAAGDGGAGSASPSPVQLVSRVRPSAIARQRRQSVTARAGPTADPESSSATTATTTTTTTTTQSAPAGAEPRPERPPSRSGTGTAPLGDEINISIFVGTWNLGNSPCPADLSAWLHTMHAAYDLVVVGAQETTLSRAQQDEERKQQKQEDRASAGMSLLQATAAASDNGAAAPKKAIPKLVKKVLEAAKDEAVQALKLEVRAHEKEADRLSREAKVAAREARWDKSKVEMATGLKERAEEAKRRLLHAKASLHGRKRELSELAKHVNVAHAAAVASAMSTAPTKKDTHFVSRVRNHVASVLGADYHELQYATLWEMKLIIFNYGNKGGVACSLRIGNTSFCFVTAHLAAHDNRCQLRNANYRRIMHELSVGHQGFPALTQFDHLWFFGDLNYRLVGLAEERALALMRAGDADGLLEHDQLRVERALDRTLVGFEEAPIAFLPTFKLLKRHEDENELEFATAQIGGLHYNLQRLPAFTDRILWRSLPRSRSRLRVVEYASAVGMVHQSDHTPLRSVFQCAVDTCGRYSSVSAPLSCFVMLSGLSCRVRGDLFTVGEGVPVLFTSATLTLRGPTFSLQAAPTEVPIPMKHMDTALDPPFLGSASMACCADMSVEYIKAQTLFCSVSAKIASATVVLGYGSLRLDLAFRSLGAARGLPFEMELHVKASDMPVGILSGFISSVCV